MAEREFIGLDNDVFRGRLRGATPAFDRRPIQPQVRMARPTQPAIVTPQTVTYPLQPKPAAMPVQTATPAVAARRPIPQQVTLKQFPPVEIGQPAIQKVAPASLSAEPIPSKAKKPKRSKMSLALAGMAVMLFATGMLVSLGALLTNHKVTQQVSALSTKDDGSAGINSGTIPDESAPPKNYGAYTVAPDLPRMIRIPNLWVNSRVLRMGVDKNNQLKAPRSVFDAGWYDGSAKPGEAGAILIDGHVSGPTKHGIFYDIKKLKAGDQIQIERGDHKVYNYSVVSSKSYPANQVDMAAALTSITPGKNGLNIMTCSGKFDSKSNEYLERLIVFAVQTN